jgi:hypothetical protein
MGLGKIYDFGKKIFSWLHFSKMGRGHSESLHSVGTSFLSLQYTAYEARWWDRQVSLDGSFRGSQIDKDLALDAATRYASAVSIGSLGAVRRFLEQSMKNTDRPHVYLTRFLEEMLNKEGQDVLQLKLKKILRVKKLDDLIRCSRSGKVWSEETLASTLSAMLGVTRKRNLLVPAWADDARLWVPSGGGGIITPTGQ